MPKLDLMTIPHAKSLFDQILLEVDRINNGGEIDEKTKFYLKSINLLLSSAKISMSAQKNEVELINARTNEKRINLDIEKFSFKKQKATSKDDNDPDFLGNILNIEKQISQFLKISGEEGSLRMPIPKELMDAGLHPLVSAIQSRHGGFKAISEKLGRKWGT